MSLDKLKKLLENQGLEKSNKALEIKHKLKDLTNKIGVFAFDEVLTFDKKLYSELARITTELDELADDIRWE